MAVPSVAGKTQDVDSVIAVEVSEIVRRSEEALLHEPPKDEQAHWYCWMPQAGVRYYSFEEWPPPIGA